ncbi:MAG: Nif3-like dinuclear metal center hexameric protein, partial [Ignavibacteria bacterium]|nr:Nif3-like dinuclear metal center hexameric protein [Ignavibacteria bacterium]
KKPVSITVIENKLNSGLNTQCTVLPFGPKKIRTVGAVSGSCSHSHFSEAITRGLDLFLTGEHKDIFHLAKDAGINIIFAGHHASETLGVKALAEVVKKKLKLETVFADLKTGL